MFVVKTKKWLGGIKVHTEEELKIKIRWMVNNGVTFIVKKDGELLSGVQIIEFMDGR